MIPEIGNPTTRGGAPAICYLCGAPLVEPTAVDHVPPRQLFAADLRRKHNLSRLLTIRTHRACNKAYEEDEQYFLHSLAAFGAKTYSGRPVLEKIGNDYRAGLHRPLVDRILNEFDPEPSGLVLPGGKVAKRFQGDRIHRVAWKIVRGLLFHHFGDAYPENWTVGVTVTAPGEQPPEHFEKFKILAAGDDLGAYPGIFTYRYIRWELAQYWALLLWDAVIITVIFHDKACQCSQCVPIAPAASSL